MKPLEQAGSVGCGSTSCSQPRGGGGLCSIPLLYEEPLGRGGRVRKSSSRFAMTRVANEALTAPGFTGYLENLLIMCRRTFERSLGASRWRPANAPLRKQPSRRCSEGCRSMVTTIPAMPFNADFVAVSGPGRPRAHGGASWVDVTWRVIKSACSWITSVRW